MKRRKRCNVAYSLTTADRSIVVEVEGQGRDETLQMFQSVIDYDKKSNKNQRRKHNDRNNDRKYG